MREMFLFSIATNGNRMIKFKKLVIQEETAMFKRVMAWILVAALCCSIVPVQTFAAQTQTPEIETEITESLPEESVPETTGPEETAPEETEPTLPSAAPSGSAP